jgi:hypothetical protein
MGRDKKNPKPLDTNAFNTLVKTASEVVRRHEQHLQATLHKSVDVEHPSGRITVTLDIVPDETTPRLLAAWAVPRCPFMPFFARQPWPWPAPCAAAPHLHRTAPGT